VHNRAAPNRIIVNEDARGLYHNFFQLQWMNFDYSREYHPVDDVRRDRIGTSLRGLINPFIKNSWE